MSQHPSATRNEILGAAALFAAAAVVFTWPLAARAGSAMTAQPFGDPLLNAWILAWGADRLSHGLAGFWDGLFFHPYPDTVAWSEHLLGITLFTAPVQWLTGNPILAFNLALVASTVLAGFGTYLLAREVTGRHDVALVAGLSFACSPYRVPQVYHLQVLMAGWMPIALWALHRHVATASRVALAWFVAAFLLQAWSNGYFLYFMALPVAIVSLHALWARRETWQPLAGRLALAAAAILVGLAPVALAYSRVRREQGLSRTLGDVIQFSADLSSYVHVSNRLWLWGSVLPLGKFERELFPGFVIVVLAIAAPWIARGAGTPIPTPRGQSAPITHVRTYLVVLLAGVVLSLGPRPAISGWVLPFDGPYAWLMAIVPGLDGLRVPARLAVVVCLALAVLAAFTLASLTSRLRPFTRKATVLLAGAAIALEGYAGPLALQRFPTPDMAADRATYEWLASQPHGPMLELPVGDTRLQVRHLYRTLSHGNRIVNGYSGYGSALQDLVAGPPFAELGRLDDGLTMARELGIRWLAVHPPLYPDPRQGDALIAALAHATAHVARVAGFAGMSIAELRPLEPRRDAIDPAWRELAADALEASASHNTEQIGLAFDRNRDTRWHTGTRQSGHEWIEVRFQAPQDVARVRIEINRRSQYDYPRGLVVEVASEEHGWTTLFEGGILPHLGHSLAANPGNPAIDLVLRRNQSTRLRLRTTGETRAVYWSVHELRVWSR